MLRERRFSVRARLVAGSVLAAVLIFAIALSVIRLQTVSILEAANDTLAAGDLTSYATEIRANPDDLVDDSGKGILIYIRDPQGRVELDTLPPPIRHAVEHRPGNDETFAGSVGRMRFTVAGRTVRTPNGEWSLWAARSVASTDMALRGLDSVFVFAGVLLLLLFAGSSWILASAALRPVERMRKKADLLSIDGSAQLPVGRIHDEFSDLAHTLNSFLHRVRESAHREKQIVSDAAHEIRTPLAALKIQLELAHDHFDDAAQLAAQIVAAEVSVARLTSLTTNLLALSRLDAEVTSRNRSTLDELITELMGAVDRARLIGQSPEVEVGFTLDASFGTAEIAVSAENFGRLLDNLFANSISAIYRENVDQRGVVTASLSQTPQEIVLTVSDNGPGMDADFIPRAFERFSRPDDSRTSSAGGNGLGLALVHGIVTSAGGGITITNTEHGLDVTLTFPKM